MKYCLLCLLFSLVANFTWAQSETATVSGQVLDPSGLNVTGAQVKLVDIDRDSSTSVTTNNTGLYTFPSVRPGRYRMKVTSAGFAVINVTGLIVNVQDHIEQNFRLQVGSIAESVTVTAGAPLVDATDATVSTVVDRQFAENLPINGRSFQSLIELTPGVVLTPSNLSDNGQFSVNGQRASSNYWMVDGVSANIGTSAGPNPGNGMGGTLGSFSAMGGTNSLVSVDAMQEFRIQTSTYAPEFGRTPGGQISIVTRSGTNQFHGTAFDYFRNDALDASDWFNGYSNNPPLPKAKERQNDFGGTFSGPILRDRSFFFFSYEGLRLRLPQTTLTTVPDISARQNALPTMQPYLNAFPLPNGSDDLANGTAQFSASYSNPATLDAYSLRIDHKFTDRLNLFGRYNYSPSEFVVRGGSNGISPLSVLQASRITAQTATFGATLVIGPTVANDLRFNYSWTKASSATSLDTFGGSIPLPSLPFPGPFSAHDANFELTIFSLNVGQTLFEGDGVQNLQRQINLVDNLSIQKGPHSWKAGVDFRRLSPASTPALYSQQVIFSDVRSAEMGATTSGTAGSIGASRDVTLLFRNFGLFAQDTWHVVPRLTLTYGLRWDLDFAPSSLNGPDIPAVTGYNLLDLSQLALAPAGTPPFETTYLNLAPRIGIAYQMFGTQDWMTVLRGGFGVFYDLVSSETGNLIGGGFPPFSSFTNVAGGTTFPFSSTQIAPPPIPGTGTISEVYAYNPGLKLPYTLEWNIALEQALGRQQTITASYVGAAGRRLLQSSQLVFPPTNPSVEFGIFIDNRAVSDYNALQAQYQRRLSRGLQILSSYCWSHSIDTGSAGSTALFSNAGIPGSSRNLNRGPSDFDIRSSFTAGVTYELPSSKNGTFAAALLRDWSVQSFIIARSASPVDISDANFFSFNNGALADVRPDVVPGQSLYLLGLQFPGGKAFNPSAFENPPSDPSTGLPLRQGDVPRNFLRGFGAAQWDLAVHRDFPVHETLKLQFRAEIFNALNHPNFGPPAAAFGLGGFGVSTQMLNRSLSGFGSSGSGGLNPLYQIGGPRSIQLAVKLKF